MKITDIEFHDGEANFDEFGYADLSARFTVTADGVKYSGLAVEATIGEIEYSWDAPVPDVDYLESILSQAFDMALTINVDISPVDVEEVLAELGEEG